MVAILSEEYKARARREATEACAVCRGVLDNDENERGVVEFLDGWFWICSGCKARVGKDFDFTQHDNYGEGEYIPYFKRSRKYWLKWLEEKFQITII